MSKQDPALAFLELYAAGRVKEALRTIYPNPRVCLDDYDASNPQYTAIINFVDAAVFGDDTQAYSSCEQLLHSLQSGSNTLPFPKGLIDKLYLDRQVLRLRRLSDEDFTEAIHQPDLHGLSQALLTSIICEHDGILLEKQEIQEMTKGSPELMDAVLYSQNWARFKTDNPSLYQDLNWLYLRAQRPPICRSYLHHSYPIEIDRLPEVPDSHIPVFFVDALDIDWEDILSPYRERPALFVFFSRYALSHSLAINAVLESVSLPEHAAIVLDAYPREQIQAQGTRNAYRGPLQAVSLHGNPMLRENEALIVDILQQFMARSENGHERRQALSNWLYRVGKTIRYSTDMQRLGKRRFLALQEYWREAELHDYYKDAPPANTVIPPWPKGYEKEILDSAKPIGPKRSVRREGKIRIAHVLPQIIDGSHASSRLLRSLCAHSDRELFELSICVTEKLVLRPMHYPVNDRMLSDSSTERAPLDLLYYESQNIPVYVDPADASFEDTAQRLAKRFSKDAIDVLILHGPDPINNLLTRVSDVPYKVFVEHGVVPDQEGYDLLILSTKEIPEALKKKYRCIGLPFALDIRESWDEEPYPKSYFGLPEGCRILTTISNHLQERLTQDVCWAITEILKRHDNVYYVPIGPLDDAPHIYKTFTEAGVSNRVWPIGTVPNPSQVARSMDLYLNEFPIGSCLGLMDAMAAGVPPVSMYDAKGPTAAKYGGAYFSIEKAIHSGRKEDYADLACQLLEDDVMYKEWAELARQRYEELSNAQAYASQIEGAIRELTQA